MQTIENDRLELRAQWRLLTKNDLQEIPDQPPSDGVTFGAGENSSSGSPHVHLRESAWHGCMRALRGHVEALPFEHGKEAKTPRANNYRPYRLTVDNQVLAMIALRASEAFNVAEVDVFLTGEMAGIEPLSSTRAAIVFAFCDAVRNGGSMAVQFTRGPAPRGLPPHVRQLAKIANVPLAHADRGTLSPEESRKLFLRLSGLRKLAADRIEILAAKRYFSVERICYLIASGLWSPHEASLVLGSSPYPDLLLGAGATSLNRHLSSVAMAHGRAAVMCGLLDRALRYVAPATLEDGEVIDRGEYRLISKRRDNDRMAVAYGPLANDIQLVGWSLVGERPVSFRAPQKLVFLPRPRGREESRMFLAQDIEAAAEAAAGLPGAEGVLVGSAELRQLTSAEIEDVRRFAGQQQVRVIAAPETNAGLESELHRRLRVGRTVRS